MAEKKITPKPVDRTESKDRTTAAGVEKKSLQKRARQQRARQQRAR